MWVLVLILIIWLIVSPSTFLIAFLVFTVLMLVVGGREAIKNEEKEKERMLLIEKEKERLSNLYYNQFKELDIDNKNPRIVKCKSGLNLAASEYYVWIENGELNFFIESIKNIKNGFLLNSIKIEDIEYFSHRGTVSKETVISGGGGEIGGSSMKGAIVGGVLAGGAGAVIGSRKKGTIAPIESKIVSHDDREVFINYFKDGIRKSVFFEYVDYMTFLDLMPEKEYNNVVAQKLSKGK